MPLEVGNMGGIGDFVAALTGGGKIRKQAEDDAWARASNIGRAKKTAAEAGIAEDKLAQRGGLAEAILAAAPPGSMTPEQAAALATIGRGGFGNFPQLAQGQSRLFDLAQTQQAAQMATQENPDVAMMNRILASRVSGGGRLTPNQVDPEGLAAALLAKEQAQADLRNRTDPNIRATSGGSAAAGGGSLSPDTMAMFSRPNPLDPAGKPSLDPEMYQQFLQWRMSTGANGNINDDARRWLATRVAPGPDIGGLGGVTSDIGGLARIAQQFAAGMPQSPQAPPAQAVQYLRANPGLAAAFDQKYGQGAAARILGGQ